MALFDFLRPKKQKPALMKREFAGANVSRLFNDFRDSNRSADSELQPVIRRLRNRSRDLARNNEYVRRYLHLLKTNVIGDRGFTLQVKATGATGALDEIGNAAIESSFKQWGKVGRCTADGKLSWVDAQKMAVEGLARDGEVFIVKHRNSAFHDSFAIEFIEPDRVDEQLSRREANGNEIRMGVEFDKFRRPVAYHMLTYHPGDYDFTSTSQSPKHVRVPADKVIHLFMPVRAGQTRGEPWTSGSLSAIKQLAGFREAAVVNARVGASKMGFFTSPSGDGFAADAMDQEVPIIDAEPGTFHQLPTGVSFTSFDPQFPTSDFDSFHKSVLKGIASGLGVSYTSLANDLEATSYSSIRQGALEERDFYRQIQQFMMEHFIRPVYESWLEAAMEIDSFSLPLRQFDRFSDASQFRGKAWSWVDPQKEMNAAILGLKHGILSLQDVASNYGKDVEELLAQIKRDKSLMEQFDVEYALEPYGATQIGIEPTVTGGEDGEVQG
jgi:lambda family phage portal protein